MSINRDLPTTDPTPDPIPFPFRYVEPDGEPIPSGASGLSSLPESADQILDAIDGMSRRIDDLARELNCLGYFDTDDDGPRAA